MGVSQQYGGGVCEGGVGVRARLPAVDGEYSIDTIYARSVVNLSMGPSEWIIRALLYKAPVPQLH